MLMKKILYALAFVALIFIAVMGAQYKKNNKSKEEALKSLSKVYELEMAYKEMFGHYSDNLYALVFIQDTLVTEGGRANYHVSLLEVTDTSFTAIAVSVIDFDKDGQFNTWTVNETGAITELAED